MVKSTTINIKNMYYLKICKDKNTVKKYNFGRYY